MLRKQQGFMLIEVMISIIIIGITFFAINSMFIQAGRAISDSDSRIIAANYAQRQMELLKPKTATWWDHYFADPDDTMFNLDATPPDSNYRIITRASNFQVGSGNSKTDLVSVNVTVIWDELSTNGSKQQKQLTYKSLYNKIE